MSEWQEVKGKIIQSLSTLYQNDNCLFKRNEGRGLSERCLVFRFAHYLQNQINSYFVDCDYNSSFDKDQPVRGKLIPNPDGETATKRFIDIIIHKRSDNESEKLACFELKKWNNLNKESINKDLNNLTFLTGNYGYKYGFHITLGKTIGKTTIKTYNNGDLSNIQTWREFKNE